MKITINAPDAASMRKVFERIIELEKIGAKARLITRDGYEIVGDGKGTYTVEVAKNEDSCVMCGDYVVEGNQICFKCKRRWTENDKERHTTSN